MAYSLLVSIVDDASKGMPVAMFVPHRIEHDMESFVWVFLFAICASALHETKAGFSRGSRDALREEFQNLFPGKSVADILCGRTRLLIPDANKGIIKHLRKSVVDRTFVGLLHFFLYDILRPRLLTQKSTTPSFSLSVLRRVKREPYNMPETEPLTHSLLLAAFEHYLEERKRNGVPEAGEASEDQASDDDEDSDDGASGEHR